MHVNIVTLFAIAVFISLPVLTIWGWLRWTRNNNPKTLFSALSLIGFALATASESIAVSMVIYARVTGGFGYYDPTLMRIYAVGMLLSLLGLILASVGAWKPSSLRWFALACTLGTLFYWLAQAAAE